MPPAIARARARDKEWRNLGGSSAWQRSGTWREIDAAAADRAPHHGPVSRAAFSLGAAPYESSP